MYCLSDNLIQQIHPFERGIFGLKMLAFGIRNYLMPILYKDKLNNFNYSLQRKFKKVRALQLFSLALQKIGVIFNHFHNLNT